MLAPIVVTSSNNVVLWSEAAGGIIAREGEAAPGTEVGVVLALSGTVAPQYNAAGKAAFDALLTGQGVSPSNDFGIWAEKLNGELTLVVREGQKLEVAPGDFRTISDLDRFGPFNDVRWFNEFGQVVFRATFTDGSYGIFVSNAATVPEPSSCLLSATALMGFTAAVVLRSRKVQ